MEQAEITKKLVDFGFSDIEAKVYYAALVMDKPTAEKISRHSGINRTSCYSVIGRLKSMGLISQVKKAGKTVFSSSSPEKLLEIMEEKKKGIEKIIPELKSLFEISAGKPSVRFYEGKEGLKAVINMILKEAKQVCAYGDGDSFKKLISDWYEIYTEKKIKSDIKKRILLKATPLAIKRAKKIRSRTDRNSRNYQIRLLPESYNINYSGFDVFNNKIVLYSFEKETIAVVVESRVISDMMKTVFEILWETAEKYDRTLLRE